MSGSNAEGYICVDWEGDEEKLYLMNSNEAAFVGGHNATNIIMTWTMCDNHMGEFEDESIYDVSGIYRDPGWGYRWEDEPECYPPEQIKDFLETTEPIIGIYANQKFINFECTEDEDHV